MLDKELKVGPVKLNLADINWPDGIQDKLDDLNDAFLGLFIMYVLGIGFAGLSMLCGIFAFFKPNVRLLSLANFTIGALGFLSLLIGSIIVTVATKKGVSALNKVGSKVGLAAERGDKFYALTWVATSFMGVITLFWMVSFCTIRRDRRRMVEKVG